MHLTQTEHLLCARAHVRYHSFIIQHLFTEYLVCARRCNSYSFRVYLFSTYVLDTVLANENTTMSNTHIPISVKPGVGEK